MSSSDVRSSLVVWRRDSAHMASCLIPARCATFNSYFGTLGHEWMIITLLSVRFEILLKKSWFFLIVNLLFTKYECIRCTIHTRARISRTVALYRRSIWKSYLKLDAATSVGLKGCSCWRTHLRCTSQTSVSIVRWVVELDSERIGGDVFVSFSGSRHSMFSLFRIWFVDGCCFQSFLIKSSAKFPKLGEERKKALQNPRNERNSVKLNGVWSSRIASVDYDGMSSCLGRRMFAI